MFTAFLARSALLKSKYASSSSVAPLDISMTYPASESPKIASAPQDTDTGNASMMKAVSTAAGITIREDLRRAPPDALSSDMGRIS